eukprot:CAMPEP_0177637332 /NCGR_PEP_ID=MMETSP0447-20121125/4916_1 /TAXON_ID=0 /ORGANISM="Stygamoeba regulata, Strain BSH-02190019" /LENGTH=478 /DNA_ID=CAMNT_0019139255 /DNA_START=102 /DNA_END=1539 /DNA_ORIENTATION=+
MRKDIFDEEPPGERLRVLDEERAQVQALLDSDDQLGTQGKPRALAEENKQRPETAPLSGVRVLDLSRVLAGPHATQLLSDLGADVIKVERPALGDDTRHWGPPFAELSDHSLQAAYFRSANRGKRSITVNLQHERGQELLRRLAGKCDVVVENYRVGALARFGLDHHTMRTLHPHLVYCSITGFGQTGPRSSQAGYDAAVQALGGLMSITGEPDLVKDSFDSEPTDHSAGAGAGAGGGQPTKVGVAVADLFTSTYAAIAILAALRRRDHHGLGAYIDLALFDCQLSMLANQALNCLTTGVSPSRLGNSHPNIVPYTTFPTADGHLMLCVGSDLQWRRFCEAACCPPELADDARFASNASRVAYRHLLMPLLERLLVARPTSQWIDVALRAGVPAAPVNTVQQALSDVQAVHRRMVVDAPDGGGTLLGNPIKMPGVLSDPPPSYRQAPPQLSQHTDEVLSSMLDFSPADIAALHRDGVV